MPYDHAVCRGRIPCGDAIASTDPTGGASAWTAGASDVTGKPIWTGGIGLYRGGLVAVSGRGSAATSCHHYRIPRTCRRLVPGRHVNDFIPRSMVRDTCPSTTLCVAGDSAGNIFTSHDPARGTSTWTRVTVGPRHVYQQGLLPVGLPVRGGRRIWWNLDLPQPTGGPRRGPGPRSMAPPAWGSFVRLSFVLRGGGREWRGADLRQPDGWGERMGTGRDVDGTTLIWAVSCPSPSLCVAGDQAGNILSSSSPLSGVASAWQDTPPSARAASASSHVSARRCASQATRSGNCSRRSIQAGRRPGTSQEIDAGQLARRASPAAPDSLCVGTNRPRATYSRRTTPSTVPARCSTARREWNVDHLGCVVPEYHVVRRRRRHRCHPDGDRWEDRRPLPPKAATPT